MNYFLYYNTMVAYHMHLIPIDQGTYSFSVAVDKPFPLLPLRLPPPGPSHWATLRILAILAILAILRRF